MTSRLFATMRGVSKYINSLSGSFLEAGERTGDKICICALVAHMQQCNPASLCMQKAVRSPSSGLQRQLQAMLQAERIAAL